MDGWSLLLLTLLNQSSSLVRIEILTPATEVATIVEICVPQAIVNRSFKHVFFDQDAKHLFDTGYVRECCISHQVEQVLDLILRRHILVEIKCMIALNNCVNDWLVLAVHKSQHLSDTDFRMLKAVSVEEFENSDNFDSILNGLWRKHHYQQSASIVHFGQKLSKLKVSVLDCLCIFDQVLLPS